MAYSVKADLIKAKDETILKQIAGTGGTINDDWIAEGIEAADSEINLNCEKYYTTPFSPVPNIIKTWSVQLALCWLYRRSNKSNKSAEDECIEIRKSLKLVSESKFDVPDGVKKLTGVIVSNVYEDNVFTMDDLEME